MGDFAIQLNKNSFGLSPDSPLSVPTLAPDASHDTALPLNHLGAIQRMDPLGKLQIAIKNSVDVLYFSTEVPFHVLFSEDGSLARGEYLQMWKEMDDNEEAISSISGVASNTEGILNRLEANNVFLIAKRKVEGKVGCRGLRVDQNEQAVTPGPAFTLVRISHRRSSATCRSNLSTT